MTYTQAIVLGLIQGLTEFLPVSSSGHLVLVPWFFGWTYAGLAFDVALHWGTLLGVLIYFRKDVLELTRGTARSLTGKRGFSETLPWLIVLGTIPAGLIGVLLEEPAETLFRSPWVVAVTLSGVGLLIGWADKKGKKQADLENITWIQALLIGTAQGLAIVPGVSRSGITIAVALFLSFKRVAAVRFSFLLSIPIILGAGVLKIDYMLENLSNPVFLSGLASAAVSGYMAISFLMKFVKTHSFTPFVIYRLALALVIVGFLLQ